jgi:hypothetical protein
VLGSTGISYRIDRNDGDLIDAENREKSEGLKTRKTRRPRSI